MTVAILVVALALIIALAASGMIGGPIGPQQTSTPTMTEFRTGITLTSPAFENQGRIPSNYTCDGEDVSPPLMWVSVLEKTRTYALILDDLDAPLGVFTHWVIFNIPATENSLPEKVPPFGTLSNGAIQGRNGFGNVGYGGPCPPVGSHRYVFHLYALDILLDLQPGITKQDLLKAMEGHVLAEAELVAIYSKA